MRKLGYKVKLTLESRAADLHRHVFLRERDAVLVVVNVGRVLKKPLVTAKGEGNLAQILARGCICVSRITHVFGAEKALRITRLRRKLRRRDVLRVLFGLRKVDRNVNLAVFRVDRPTAVLLNAVFAYVVGVDGKMIEIIARLFGIFAVKLKEFPEMM